MLLIPPFEIGIWNAWIFMIWPLIQTISIRLASKNLYQRAGQPSDMKPSQRHKIASYVSMPTWLLATLYSIFLPFQLGTAAFYFGLIIFSLGLSILIIATINFAATPLDEPITRGVYRYSRHPMYIAIFFTYLSVAIASASWVFLLFSIVYLIPSFVCAVSEERYCLEKYGNAYREYMNKTPRWIGIPKSREK